MVNTKGLMLKYWLALHQSSEVYMNDFQLNINIREAVNGWLVEFTKGDDTVEYVYSRPGPCY